MLASSVISDRPKQEQAWISTRTCRSIQPASKITERNFIKKPKNLNTIWGARISGFIWAAKPAQESNSKITSRSYSDFDTCAGLSFRPNLICSTFPRAFQTPKKTLWQIQTLITLLEPPGGIALQNWHGWMDRVCRLACHIQSHKAGDKSWHRIQIISRIFSTS